jgi:mono/diheme cytochrome c family protein
MNRRLLILLTLVLAVVVLAAAGCGGGDDGGGEATPPADTAAAGGGETPAEPEGDPTAGATVFSDAGCGNCHTLADAGASGTVGPDLDALKPDFDQVKSQVTEGGGGMPAYGDSLSAQEIADVSAYVSSVAGQ